MVLIGIGITILLSIPFAFMVGGAAHDKEQHRKDDSERQNQVYRAQGDLYNYARENNGLFPESLSEARREGGASQGFADPITQVPYVYTVGATRTDFHLCTTMQSGEEFCIDGTAPKNREVSKPASIEKVPSHRNEDGTFYNTYHDYSIRFPTSWKKGPEGDNPSVITFLSPGEAANVQIWVTPASEEMDMPWFSNLRKTKLATTRGFQVTSERDTTLNGMPAHAIEYTWESPSGDPIRTRMTMLIRGDYYYEFSATARGGEFSGTEATFSNILSSFKITQ